MGRKSKNKNKSGPSGLSKYKCELCDDRDKNKPIVACDQCDKWYHFECVNIVSVGKNDVWICEQCKQSTTKSIQPTFNCELCRHPDNSEMIRCNECQQKYQFVCVEPDLDKLPKPFVCMNCCMARQSNLESASRIISKPISSRFDTQSYRIPELSRLDDFSTYSHPITVPYSHQGVAPRPYSRMKLDYLDEQRKLNERLDRERGIREHQYLQRRYEILQDDNDPNMALQRSEYTENWVKCYPQHLPRPEKMTTNQRQDGSFHTSDFEKRLEKLNFDDTSPLKQQSDKKKDLSTPNMTTRCPVHTNVDETERSLNELLGQLQLVPKENLQEENLELTKGQIASRHVIKSDLPNFYGDPMEWLLWFSSYESSTKLCGYSNGENIHRLNKCLKGKAHTAVKHRLMSSSEVPNIIATLRMLYGRPEQIVGILLKNIKEIPSPKPDKLETLVDYAMEVNSITATIASAKLSFHLSNPTLIHELVQKLPTHTKIDWAKFKATQQNVTLKTLAEWLYGLAEIICTVTNPSTSKPDEKADKKPKKSFERVNIHQVEKDNSKNSTSPDGNNTPEVNTRQTNQCKICQQKCPDVSQCSTFKSYSIKQKWDTIGKYKLCRKCLRSHSGYCRLSKECGVNGCVYKHHPYLHNDRPMQKNYSPRPKDNSSEAIAVVHNNFHRSSIADILFRLVPVTLYNDKFIVKTYAYLDEGSSGTLIEEELVNELQLNGFPEQLCLLWTNNVHRIEKESCRMDLVISGQNEFNARYQMKGVRTVKDLGLPTQSINLKELIERFPYLKGIPLIDYVNETPRILIGLPHARLCTQLASIEGDENQPIASKSRIGWSLQGSTREQEDNYVQRINEHRVNVCDRIERDEELHQLVKEHFSLENFGVKINTDFNLNSKENERALRILKDNTRRVDGRFETALLWRYDSFELEDSYDMTKRRLICLEKSKRNYIHTINDTIKDYITKGYVSKLTPQDLAIDRSKVGYLPIFIVANSKKPDKLRMVFDAAAKTKGKSLNDMLLKGPDQLSSLIDILRRFREHPIAICADIFEMYHQIEVCEADKHVQRFLWRNGNTDREPDQYVLNVMTFGAKCSPSAAQFVKNSNAEEFREELPKAVDAIVLNTYVDDMMDGDATEEKVIQLTKDVQRIHNHGRFKIGKFLSNSPKVLEALGEQNGTEMKQLAVDSIQKLERVLGMFWNTTTDCFMFSLKYTKISDDVISGKRYPTKRELLQTLMSIFDPLGLIQHFLVRLKILLQKVRRSKLQWDDKLIDEDHKEFWDSWFKLLPQIEVLEIPRLYAPNLSTSSIDLHVFVDASEDAYAAVAFLRIESEQQIKCVLVGSKTRVAPIKYVSIPRLELQAGVLGTRFMKSIEISQNFKCTRRFIWTDSRTVIS